MDDVPMNLPCIFHFTPFAEFGRDADKETDLTVKGLVLKSFPIKLSRHGLWSRDYILVNHEKKLVVLRTWKYGKEPVSLELQHSLQDPPLLIVEHVKVTTFSGISLSTKNSTIFLQDPPINEDVPLKQWYRNNSAAIEQLLNARKFHDPTQFLELPQHADLIPIQMAMNSIDTLKTCWVAGKIRLILGQRSFWFPSCSFCNRNMNAEPGWEQWCIPCQEKMVVQYRCHFDVTLSDESGSLSADLFSPDAEMLLGCDALQLEEKNMPLPFLERTIKNAIADKHVVCFIKPYDRPVRGVNMRSFPIVKLYAFEDVYPPTKLVQSQDNVESSATGLDPVVSDCSLAKTKDDKVEFFTPTTKKVLTEVSQEILQHSDETQLTGLKRTLFPKDGASSDAAAATNKTATNLAEKEMDASSMVDMETTTPVKKNRNKEKMN